MDVFCGEPPAIDSFSLVAYVPQPLGGFIQGVRQEIQSGCTTRSHLTFLPPRLLTIPLEQIRRQLEEGLRNQNAFRVELSKVQVFPVSNAIHLTLSAGSVETIKIHELLHRNGLTCKETFEYHPHVTLAQDVDPRNVPSAVDLAKSRWQEYSGSREFLVDHVTLVQHKPEGWITLAEFALRVPVSV